MSGGESPYFMSNEEWYKVDKETGRIVLTDKAPKKAVDSYYCGCEPLDEDAVVGTTVGWKIDENGEVKGVLISVG